MKNELEKYEQLERKASEDFKNMLITYFKEHPYVDMISFHSKGAIHSDSVSKNLVKEYQYDLYIPFLFVLRAYKKYGNL